jgi:FKBP12-rapamycin complex-associated protein
MSFEEYAAVEEEIFSHLLKLMHSIDLNERLAGVAGIDALIGVTSADEEMKSTKFAKNLSYAMKANNVEYLYLSGITKALGKIFLGSSNVDYVECEVIKAIEWLRKERSDRR